MNDCLDWQDEFSLAPPLPPEPTFEVCVLPAALSRLPVLLDFVTAQASRACLTSEDSSRLAIVMEELFVNTVRHGYANIRAGASAPAIRLCIDRSLAGVVKVDYRDRGRPFNPLTEEGAASSDKAYGANSLRERLGGVGLWLLRYYVQEAEYSYKAGVNRLQFQLGKGEVLPSPIAK